MNKLIATVAALGLVGGVAGVAGAAQTSPTAGGQRPAPYKTMSLAPQGTYASSPTSYGPSLSASGSSDMRVGFVVPPDRGTRPLRMRVVYLEDSPGACSWQVSGSGLEGPDGPNTEPNVHNGGWRPPGETGYSGYVSVPVGAGSAHKATFTWPFQSDPGMFIQFALQRNGADAGDTCSSVTIVGLELRY